MKSASHGAGVAPSLGIRRARNAQKTPNCNLWRCLTQIMSVVNGRYILSSALGEGAYGVVCKAYDIKLDRRPVAIKTLDLSDCPAGESACSWNLASVKREVSLMQRLDHANVLRVLDFIEGDDKHWLVTEFCQGPDVQKILNRRGALQLVEAATIIAQCVAALRHLHAHHVVHRDVKPANVVVFDPLLDLHRSPLQGCTVKLVDFGLARLLPQPCDTPSEPRRLFGGLFSRSPVHSRESSTHNTSPARSNPNSLHGNSGHGLSQLFAALRSSPVASREGSRHGCTHGGNFFASIAKPSASSESEAGLCKAPPTKSPVGLRRFGCGASPRRPSHEHGIGLTIAVDAKATKPASSSPMTPPRGAPLHGASRTLNASPSTSPEYSAHGTIADLSAHGTIAFAPPEVHAAWERGCKSISVSARDAARWDVYALGLMLRYMLLGVPPDGFVEPGEGLPWKLKPGGKFFLGMRLPWQKKRPPPPPPLVRDATDLPAEVASLVEQMTATDAAKRIGLSGLAAHPWIVESRV